MLLGTFTPKLDDKFRLILPSKIREQLQNGLVLTRGKEECLYILSQKEYKKMYKNILKAKGDARSTAYRLRQFTSDAENNTPDKQGRIVVPAKLREYANLESEVTIIGVGNHAEIWNTAALDEYMSQKPETDEKMDEGVF